MTGPAGDRDNPNTSGDALLDSFRERAAQMRQTVDLARDHNIPLIYVNDEHGCWNSNAPGPVRDALEAKGGDLVKPLVPAFNEPVLLKHRYSAFDHTPLDIFLEERKVRRVVLIGAATEGCVVQTAIDARELGLKASIVVDACATNEPELEAVALRYARRVVGVDLGRIAREPKAP